MNYKEIIISELTVLAQKETIEKNVFKARAYNTVIKQLKSIECIKSINDLKNVKGVGDKIKSKIEEIFHTGKLRASERARNNIDLNLYDALMKIHGIGAVKAKELIDTGIKSIEELKDALNDNPDLLNNIQKIGLKYYDDINLKISRKEMIKHDSFLQEHIKIIDKDINMNVVGSYRRELKESGDIDLLITLNRNSDSKERSDIMCKIINKLKELNYIKDSLALGPKKFMGVVKLKHQRHFRRMDILITSQEEYPFALCYFTGSAELNIMLRQKAIDMGYRLNEYSLSKSNGEKILLKSEKEIFNKLGLDYISPNKRSKLK